ncbi:Ankyrin repeat protein [Balamuthia mandrillaris]
MPLCKPELCSITGAAFWEDLRKDGGSGGSGGGGGGGNMSDSEVLDPYHAHSQHHNNSNNPNRRFQFVLQSHKWKDKTFRIVVRRFGRGKDLVVAKANRWAEVLWDWELVLSTRPDLRLLGPSAFVGFFETFWRQNRDRVFPGGGEEGEERSFNNSFSDGETTASTSATTTTTTSSSLSSPYAMSASSSSLEEDEEDEEDSSGSSSEDEDGERGGIRGGSNKNDHQFRGMASYDLALPHEENGPRRRSSFVIPDHGAQRSIADFRKEALVSSSLYHPHHPSFGLTSTADPSSYLRKDSSLLSPNHKDPLSPTSSYTSSFLKRRAAASNHNSNKPFSDDSGALSLYDENKETQPIIKAIIGCAASSFDISNPDYALILKLIEQGVSSVNERDETWGQTPLHFSCSKGMKLVVAALLEKGADSNVTDWHGWTPLHCACKGQFLEVCKLLMDSGADPTVQSADGNLPLHYLAEVTLKKARVAKKTNNPTTITSPIRRRKKRSGTKTSTTEETEKAESKEGTESGIGRALRMKEKAEDESSTQTLKSDEKELFVQVLLQMLSGGAQVNTQNKQGETPMHKAAMSGSWIAVHLLLKYSPVDVNLRNNNKDTCLFYATHRNDLAVAKLLLENGADPLMRGKQGTCKDIATQNNFKDLLELFEKYKDHYINNIREDTFLGSFAVIPNYSKDFEVSSSAATKDEFTSSTSSTEDEKEHLLVNNSSSTGKHGGLLQRLLKSKTESNNTTPNRKTPKCLSPKPKPNTPLLLRAKCGPKQENGSQCTSEPDIVPHYLATTPPRRNCMEGYGPWSPANQQHKQESKEQEQEKPLRSDKYSIQRNEALDYDENQMSNIERELLYFEHFIELEPRLDIHGSPHLSRSIRLASAPTTPKASSPLRRSRDGDQQQQHQLLIASLQALEQEEKGEKGGAEGNSGEEEEPLIRTVYLMTHDGRYLAAKPDGHVTITSRDYLRDGSSSGGSNGIVGKDWQTWVMERIGGCKETEAELEQVVEERVEEEIEIEVDEQEEEGGAESEEQKEATKQQEKEETKNKVQEGGQEEKKKARKTIKQKVIRTVLRTNRLKPRKKFYSFKSFHGRYLTVLPDGILRADKIIVKEREIFQRKERYDQGKRKLQAYGFKSHIGCYIGANSRNNRVQADSVILGHWQVWHIRDAWTDSIRRDQYDFAIDRSMWKDYARFAQKCCNRKVLAQRKEWKKYLSTHHLEKEIQIDSPQLSRMAKIGIPHEKRSKLWYKLSGAEAKAKASTQNYADLLAMAAKKSSPYKDQIEQDLKEQRFPNHSFLSNHDSKAAIGRVLTAYSLWDLHVGYSKPLMYITAMLLLVTDEEGAFWLLTKIAQDMFKDYFSESSVGLLVDQKVMVELLTMKLPHLMQILTREIIDLSHHWLLHLFIYTLPTEAVFRLWDCIFCEGHSILFSFLCAILRMYEDTLLRLNSPQRAGRVLRSFLAQCFDIDKLLEIAFKVAKDPTFQPDYIHQLRLRFTQVTETQLEGQNKNKDIVYLQENTLFNREELEHMYSEFRVATRSSRLRNGLDLFDFPATMNAISQRWADVPFAIVQRLFQFWDINRDEVIDFRELVIGLSPLLKGPAHQLLHLFFLLFSENEDEDTNPWVLLNGAFSSSSSSTFQDIAIFTMERTMTEDAMADLVECLYLLFQEPASPLSPRGHHGGVAASYLNADLFHQYYLRHHVTGGEAHHLHHQHHRFSNIDDILAEAIQHRSRELSLSQEFYPRGGREERETSGNAERNATGETALTKEDEENKATRKDSGETKHRKNVKEKAGADDDYDDDSDADSEEDTESNTTSASSGYFSDTTSSSFASSYDEEDKRWGQHQRLRRQQQRKSNRNSDSFFLWEEEKRTLDRLC